MVGRGEDGQDETWALTPARWPLPRHYFARIVFIARAFSHVGSLLKRQGQGNPLRLWGQRRGDRRSTDSHLAAEPAIGKNSLDYTKAYRDQMMGNNRPLGCLCDFVLVNYLGTSASRMQSLTCKSIEDRTTLC